MPLFGRTRKPATRQPTLTVDPAVGDADAARLREAMAARDWPTARTVLTAGHDHDDFAFLVHIGSLVPDSEQWLPDVVRADLKDPLPLLMYGARAIDWAWQARSAARAKYVGRDQFKLFFERLRLAEDCLQDVVRRDPSNTAAWTALITTARGLQLEKDEARRRFDKAVQVHPIHFRAHGQLLQYLCNKWFGSHEEMHAFAREAVAAAPPGSRLGSLVATAHIEEWLDRDDVDHFRSATVLPALSDAADRSVRHPDYRQGKGWPLDNNPFAMAFSLAGDQPAAAAQFRVIGDLVTNLPWNYLQGGPAGAFLARRVKAYAAAR